ncbi:ATP-binding cassette, subfamily F, uup [Tindallia magadiensis]|uniref:ATP-binding cassette, subfamily F, uup n=1 Tax=Tindallia magadiensis TaxID=69895 RepID=A0A1I3FTR7_9FIRM|nr:ABC-F family ATP-binding cassette domain-containing protein [Tindallia magadiensis]SFI14452.1 ATP-binding cassette, subfamily F, uup [Tindallia magadiensis]
MNYVSLENVTHQYGIQPILKDVTLYIGSETKLGIIGANGTGKTTLLNILAGKKTPDSGNVSVHPNCRVEMVSQETEEKMDHTVLEAVMKSENPEMKLLSEYNKVTEQLQHFPNNIQYSEEWQRLHQQIEDKNLWKLETQAKTILTKLGLSDYQMKVEQLSGGQRRRISLARSLIQPSELLVLDEPTNHLDLAMISWLEDWLRQRKQALVIVTHDRYFLDRVTSSIGELEEGKWTLFSGAYQYYLEKKQEIVHDHKKEQQRMKTIFKKELAWIRRGARARSTKQKARIERFENLEEKMVKDSENQLDIPLLQKRMGKQVLEAKEVSFSYKEGKPILQDVNFLLKPGEIVGIVGKNGTGKSTLLQLMAGNLDPIAGTMKWGKTIKMAYLDQESKDLNPELRVLEYAREGREYMTVEGSRKISASQLLERFMFSQERQWTEIGKLSGGEKRRLYLMRQLMEEPNFLLLDEPTNDLDLYTLTLLEEYLLSFEGTVIISSHDRYLLDRLADRLFILEGDGKVQEYQGSCSEWMERQSTEKSSKPDKDQKKSKDFKTNGGDNKKRKGLKLSFNEKKEYEALEPEIQSIEKQIEVVEKQMEDQQTDFVALQNSIEEKERLEDCLEEKLMRWAELTEKIEKMNKDKE